MNYQIMRDTRKKQKITQDDLAALLGVNRATVSKYETGAIDPPITQQMKIAQILDIDIFVLMDDEAIESYFAANERKKNLLHNSGIIIDNEGATAPVDTFIGQFMEITKNLNSESKSDLLMISECFAEVDKEDQKQTLKFAVFLTTQSKYRNENTGD